jgi:hypothetical protein
MPRIPIALLRIVTTVLAVNAARAAESENPASPPVVPQPAPAARPRLIFSRVEDGSTLVEAKVLAVGEKPPTQPVLALSDLPPPDKDVFRLPAYIVQEPKLPAFKERELLTPKGKIDLALKRHPGLRFGSLPFFSNNGIGLAMLEEEFRLERLHEMADLMTLLPASSQKDLKPTLQDTTIRR